MGSRNKSLLAWDTVNIHREPGHTRALRNDIVDPLGRGGVNEGSVVCGQFERRKTMAHIEEVNSESSLGEVGLLIRHGHEHIALVGQDRKHLAITRSPKSVLTK